MRETGRLCPVASGRVNVAVGLFTLALFMLYGFFLIYLRDFAPGKEEWIAQYGLGKHFEARLAHVHGGLFALLNLAVGLVLMRLEGGGKAREAAGLLTLLGMLMPLGILAEVYLHTSPVPVLVGGVCMVAGMLMTGWLSLRLPLAAKE